MTTVTEHQEPPVPGAHPGSDVRSWEVCIASIFGGIFVGIADVIFNSEPVTFRIAEASRQVIGDIAFSVSFETIAFLVILGLGLGLCFIYRPRTRLGAFGRGSSVIAVLAGMNIAVPASARAAEIVLGPSTPVSTCEPRAYGLLGLGTVIHGDAKGCWTTGVVNSVAQFDCLSTVEIGKERFCEIALPADFVARANGHRRGWVRN